MTSGMLLLRRASYGGRKGRRAARRWLDERGWGSFTSIDQLIDIARLDYFPAQRRAPK
jgi:hypothetical protein